ncbi:MAG: 4-hydroxy-tetrahydrodipicolinate synthase [Acidobacteriota bacterium]|nr:4-hydroxy-tetrahydrodipicolinate synthase [Acidobacteriota bacterium]MDH3785081.1 4-hydroxy-tetrahydrodipicolinate synthase [Acidobacteriota bacterium]
MDRLTGAMTALVTPFDRDGRVDAEALASLVRRQIEEGIDGLVPCGTTGEGATLDADEQEAVVRVVTETAAGKVPVLAGCGSNDTRRTIEAGRRAIGVGADALLVVTPYYNKPNRAGMIGHYRAVTEACDRPVIVYNVPGRTGQNLPASWTLELSELPGIVGVKEASADLEQISEILRHRSAGFAVLSGDDALTLSTVALGAEGVISVVANQDPAGMSRLVASTREGDLDSARKHHFRLLPLMQANFVESNPVPVKASMELLGLCSGMPRPPLAPADGRTRERLSAALDTAGLRRVS